MFLHSLTPQLDTERAAVANIGADVQSAKAEASHIGWPRMLPPPECTQFISARIERLCRASPEVVVLCDDGPRHDGGCGGLRRNQ